MSFLQERIRNFCVVSHIDHGKTTLTDRFLEITHTQTDTKLKERILDSNPIEQERGITIKLSPVRMIYQNHLLNLIDTPGHVDFSYEVSRSLTACEGALLLVDATQGIQAQTMANAYQALEHNLTILPVINKIDLANAEIAKTTQQLQETFGFKPNEIINISAKTGQNLIQLIKAIIKHLPSPQGNPKKPLKALVFNSFYHPHKGVIAYVRLIDGQINPTDALILTSNQTQFTAEEIGFFSPTMYPTITSLSTGEVGYIATGLKNISLCRPGDTLTLNPPPPNFKPLPGYQEPKPMVFMDLYPVDNHQFVKLKKSLNQLQLVDSSLSFNPVNSPVLGSGFKIGFQGLLHADIVQERLEREFNLQLITTTPSVEYLVELKKNRKTFSVFSPANFPNPTLINQTKEPFIELTIFTPVKYLGNIMNLCQDFRAQLKDQKFFGQQVKLTYHLPLQELISDFFSQLKSTSSGFASLDWQFLDFRPANIVKLEVLINRQAVDPLAVLVVRSQAQPVAKNLAKKLKAVIPRQQFEVPIQIALGGKILARETIKAFRKDVTAKLYGGDQTRKDKLLKKQKKGKKRLKRIGKIILPQEAFLAALQK
jgi:GTP-binding protein LepA